MWIRDGRLLTMAASILTETYSLLKQSNSAGRSRTVIIPKFDNCRHNKQMNSTCVWGGALLPSNNRTGCLSVIYTDTTDRREQRTSEFNTCLGWSIYKNRQTPGNLSCSLSGLGLNRGPKFTHRWHALIYSRESCSEPCLTLIQFSITVNSL